METYGKGLVELPFIHFLIESKYMEWEDVGDYLWDRLEQSINGGRVRKDRTRTNGGDEKGAQGKSNLPEQEQIGDLPRGRRPNSKLRPDLHAKETTDTPRPIGKRLDTKRTEQRVPRPRGDRNTRARKPS